MNYDFFINKLSGNWIIQSIKYSSSEKHKFTNTFINKIQWTYLKDHKKYLKFLKSNLSKQYNLNQLSLYLLESKTDNNIDNKSYILILSESQDTTYMIKFNSQFQFVNKYMIQDCSQNYLKMVSYIQNITLVEKIYFLNKNLKLIKSTIKKNKYYIGTSFSSEIRIS